jgi:hypothetical protein
MWDKLRMGLPHHLKFKLPLAWPTIRRKGPRLHI